MQLPLKYYWLLKAWSANEAFDFEFNDAHEINNIYDKSEESIKAGLEERFRNTKLFILLVGKNTKNLFKYVRWEIEQAIKRGIPIIVVNLNNKRQIDYDLCPPLLRDELAIHISFEQKIIGYAMNDWIQSDKTYREEGKKGPYYYSESTYSRLGL